MRYPVSLSDKLEKVEEVFTSWNCSLKFDEVVNWILQFDSEDYDLAIRIIANINFLNYGDIKSALSIAYSKLIRKAIEKNTKITHRNTLFAGVGDFGKSGSMMSYNFRVINELSEENFTENDALIEEGNVKNIVLIDDILSTGTQASKEIKKLTEKVTPYGVENIFLLTVCGMKSGIIKVEEETKAYTFAAFEYSNKDTVIDLDGNFYKGLTYEERELAFKRIGDYGKIAYQKQPYGFGRIGGLIAFDFNTPNTSLPLIWSNANSWIPLFKRAKRINGINAYYKQFEKKTKEKKEETPKEINSISIYVEGKIEEIFFDALQKEKNFAEDLGFQKANIIALGGSIISKRLLNQLSSIDERRVFVLENDLHTKKNAKQFEGEDINVVYLEPNIMGFFKIKELAESESENKKILDLMHGSEITDLLYFEMETLLLKKYSSASRSKRIQQYVSKHLDNNKYNDFVQEIKNKLNAKK